MQQVYEGIGALITAGVCFVFISACVLIVRRAWRGLFGRGRHD
jgi:hypothetical protein